MTSDEKEIAESIAVAMWILGKVLNRKSGSLNCAAVLAQAAQYKKKRSQTQLKVLSDGCADGFREVDGICVPEN